MVDVEQHALRALEEDALAGTALVFEQIPYRVHERQNFRRDGEQLVAQARRLDLRQAETAPQRIVMRQRPRDLVVERIGFGEVHEADRAAPDLVLVGGADPALRRADFRPAARRLLAMRVEFAMQRKNERRVFRDLEIHRRDGDALLPQAIDLADEEMRIDDDAIANDREFSRPHDAGRQQRELVGDAVDDERMAGVVAALKAHDDIRLQRQPVDDLALALVAPLGANHRHIRHLSLPSRNGKSPRG